MTCLLLVSGQTVWRRDVRDVAAIAIGICAALVESAFASAVPLGSAKHAGVNAACRW